MDRRKSPSRAGFTLVEVLVAVLIIGILIALLVPTLAAAFRKAKESQVSAEVNNIATALASFQNTYGDYPPSRVILCERGYTTAGVLSNTHLASTLADSNCTDITVAQLAQRSLLYLRKFWPRVDFLGDPGVTAQPGYFNDFNGNMSVDSADSNGNPYIILTGSECLAFFLGGIPVPTATPMVYGVSGFSKSPTRPFVDPVTATNRTASNYDFNVGRLFDLDGDKFPSYLDPINTVPGNRRAFAYFSAYGTNAYDPNDVNGYDHNTTHAVDYEIDPNDPTAMAICEWGFSVGNLVTNGSATSNVAVSPAPNPYTSGLTVPGVSTSVAWINPKSFQIISCGQDGLFGYGGTFLQGSSGGTGPLPLQSSGQVNTYTGTPTTRLDENDNLTNFSAGRLN